MPYNKNFSLWVLGFSSQIDTNVFTFVKQLRDAFDPSFFGSDSDWANLQSGDGSKLSTNWFMRSPAFMKDPLVREIRGVLRASPHTLVSDFELFQVSQVVSQQKFESLYNAGDIWEGRYDPNYSYKNTQKPGPKPREIKKAAKEGRIKVFRAEGLGAISLDYRRHPSVPCPRFDYEEVLAANLQAPKASEADDLTVAADILSSKGIWLGEPMALWFNNHRESGNFRAKTNREKANSLLRGLAPWLECFANW